jgi:hypothetical protein
MAANAVVGTRCYAFDLITKLQNLFRANSDTEATSLAPLRVDFDAVLRQKTHLPSHFFGSFFVSQPFNVYDWHNLGYYGKDFTFIQGKD